MSSVHEKVPNVQEAQRQCANIRQRGFHRLARQREKNKTNVKKKREALNLRAPTEESGLGKSCRQLDDAERSCRLGRKAAKHSEHPPSRR